MAYSDTDWATHAVQVAAVSQEIKKFHSKGRKIRIYHGSTNSTRPIEDKDERVDVSRLNRILDINVGERYVLVEPNVPMDRLIDETLKYGLIPPVVTEFPGITVGGAIQGAAGESSSFRYGLFHASCVECEAVLGNGEIVRASSVENSDLFFGMAGSYGSLCVITLVKLKLIPAKRFVQISYVPTNSAEEAVSLIKKYVKTEVDFVDAILFSENSGVIILGRLVNEEGSHLIRFSRSFDQWFYLHVKNIALQPSARPDTLPLKDYLFRYDRGGFWMGRFGYEFLGIPFNRITRFIFNYFAHTRVLYQALHSSGLSQRFIVQDISLPEEKASEFIDSSFKELGIRPLWICPLKTDLQAKLSPNYLHAGLVINIGLWGEVSGRDTIELNRILEKKIQDLSGRKILYAHSYYTQSEFWRTYDRDWYYQLRDKYRAETFPDIHEKVSVKGRYKGSVGIGFLNFLRSSRYSQ